MVKASMTKSENPDDNLSEMYRRLIASIPYKVRGNTIS